MDVVLVRQTSTSQGTIGQVYIEGTLFCYSMELPWRNNTRNLSCIPNGQYPCIWGKSPTFGWCYTVQEVPKRSFIRIHSGNVAGDITKGYRTHSKGCPLLGTKVGVLYNQKAVLSSKLAKSDFDTELNEEPFVLTVIGGYK